MAERNLCVAPVPSSLPCLMSVNGVVIFPLYHALLSGLGLHGMVLVIHCLNAHLITSTPSLPLWCILHQASLPGSSGIPLHYVLPYVESYLGLEKEFPLRCTK